jgi:hypothetical protein
MRRYWIVTVAGVIANGSGGGCPRCLDYNGTFYIDFYANIVPAPGGSTACRTLTFPSYTWGSCPCSAGSPSSSYRIDWMLGRHLNIGGILREAIEITISEQTNRGITDTLDYTQNDTLNCDTTIVFSSLSSIGATGTCCDLTGATITFTPYEP